MFRSQLCIENCILDHWSLPYHGHVTNLLICDTDKSKHVVLVQTHQGQVLIHVTQIKNATQEQLGPDIFSPCTPETNDQFWKHQFWDCAYKKN